MCVKNMAISSSVVSYVTDFDFEIIEWKNPSSPGRGKTLFLFFPIALFLLDLYVSCF